MKIAVINSGSSSLKFKLFEMPSKKLLFTQVIQQIGERHSDIKNHEEALESLDVDFSSLDAIGHRVVHGGKRLKESCEITDEVMEIIKNLIPLAPLHNAANLKGIKVAKKKAPNIPQIAVFDTTFHATMEKEAFLYAIPYEMYEKNRIRRYGFHGISHAYLTKEAAKVLNKPIDEVNLITLHLGNGASACAVKNGKSHDTSMGFTPLTGLVMGTRCGDIDPEIPLFLERVLGFSEAEVEEILNKKSGLQGICGKSDLREILQSDDDKAKLAVNIMVRRIQKYIGSYLVLLENVDAIVFSGGIGENSSYIRERVMDNKIISGIKSLVIKTNEELEIANECYRILKS